MCEKFCTLSYTGATTGTSSSCSASTGATSGLADGDTTFTYDADGNMTSVSDPTGYTLYVFDGENRLIEVRPNAPTLGQKRVTMAYDFMGRRIKKDVYIWTNPGPDPDSFSWTISTSRTFTWDGWLMTDETVTTGSAQPETTSYVWGLDLSQSFTGAGGVGGLLSMTGKESNNFNCYLYDANGNVTQLLDSSINNLTANYEYDFNGNIICTNIFTQDSMLKFSTKYHDNEYELYYFGYRYYSYNYGKFLNKDIIAETGGLNLYAYAKNNLNLVENLGLWAFWTHKQITTEAYDYEAYLSSLANSSYNSNNDLQSKHIFNTILQSLIAGNMSQDLNVSNSGKHFRHYTLIKKNVQKSDRDKADLDYANYLQIEYNNFKEYLQHNDIFYCRKALWHLGLLSHSQQDFFGHGIRSDLGGPHVTEDRYYPLGSSNSYATGWNAWIDQVTGTPENREKFMPSTWSLQVSERSEHPPTFTGEPLKTNTQEYDLRYSASKSYTKKQLQEKVSEWLEHCGCVANLLNESLPNNDV